MWARVVHNLHDVALLKNLKNLSRHAASGDVVTRVLARSGHKIRLDGPYRYPPNTRLYHNFIHSCNIHAVHCALLLGPSKFLRNSGITRMRRRSVPSTRRGKTTPGNDADFTRLAGPTEHDRESGTMARIEEASREGDFPKIRL